MSTQRKELPLDRPTREEVSQISRAVASHNVLSGVLNAAGVGAMVLNHQRQVLFANEDLLQLVGVGSLADVVGLLSGEALGCINALPGGCGDSSACEGCSALDAIVSCRETGASAVTDCILTVQRDHRLDAREFRLKASPMILDGEQVIVVTLRDISAERRREALERVFFHDVLNTITGLYGFVELLEEEPDAADAPAIVARIARICARLRREVQDQRSLLEAETGKLRVENKRVRSSAILEQVAQFFAGHVEVTKKELQVACEPGEAEIVTDQALLTRVLINMVKNAFEATAPGGVVRLACGEKEGRTVLSVWNAGQIPKEVAAQIFRRSFSTKGNRGRGLGTYSMKLFGERYLGGQVGFSSDPDPAGTVFFIRLPLQPAGTDPRRP